ncbi:hypothetical protein X801_04210 [Opisthorchis viverrini]|uniref:Tetratricopeptide repeat protein n=1 Tax=Opisthorchis viverrini TaxID=6198 RepID=A0A1S8X069_OPIVI|nr:hypothetical protein X801_04210 [Opisthorchis viverrini]
MNNGRLPHSDFLKAIKTVFSHLQHRADAYSQWSIEELTNPVSVELTVPHSSNSCARYYLLRVGSIAIFRCGGQVRQQVLTHATAMDKELKSKLKDAKKFYQKGEYDECQKLTQEILTEDSKSYQALVLKAACCDQLECEDEAADCFFHAINVDPGSMLAWQTPEGLTGLPDLCILVLKSEPSNPYALELLLRSQIERFLIVGLPFFISSSLIGPPVEFPVMVELLDELLDPETEERLDSLYKYSDTLGERSSKTASATVHLGRLILLAAATLRNPESDFCSDTWKSITERVDSIALNDCVGLANWHKRGYMDFHVCCLHALAAFKQHLFDRCEMVLKKILTECAVKMSTAAEDSRQLSVLSTVPLSQLTDFLTPRPMCSPFRCDLNSIRISYGGALRSPYDLIKEWALTVRMANAAASELSHVTSRLVAELLPMWLKPMSFVWPSVSQTLWMECCLSINRLDLALRVLLPLDVNEPTVDKVVEHALLVERSEIRLRICALWTAFIFILQNKRLESDKKPCRSFATACAVL